MFRFLEWMFMVVIPSGCAVLLTIGFVMHLGGRLGLALNVIAPSRRGRGKSVQER